MKDELLEQYKAMAKQGTMEERIDAHLKANCEKYDPKKLKDCVKHLVDVAREILDSKNGNVPDEVCYRICRDYFNDELWKKEDEEKAEREKKQAERAAQNAAKKKAAEERKKAAEAKKAEAARKKAEEERKAAELKRMKEEAEREANAADEAKKAEEAKKANVCPGQLDFLAAMGV